MSNRINGVLAAPPALVELVTDYVMGVAATNGKVQLETYKLPKNSALRAEVLKAANRINQTAKLHKSPELGYQPAYRIRVNVDFSGLGPSYPVAMMRRQNPEITLLLSPSMGYGGKVALGSWAAYHQGKKVNTLSLFVGTFLGLEPLRPLNERSWRNLRMIVRDTIRHELQHFMQTAMYEAVEAKAGRTPEYNRDRVIEHEKKAVSIPSWGMTYYTSPIEFNTYLADFLGEVEEQILSPGVTSSVQGVIDALAYVDPKRFISKRWYDENSQIKAQRQRILRELSALVSRHNDVIVSQRRRKLPVNAQQVMAELLTRTERAGNKALVAYLRQHRNQLEAWLAAQVPKEGIK